MKSSLSIDHNLLWERFRKGEGEAFKQIYELYFDDLLNYGLYICHKEAMVEDAIHDVFVDLFHFKKKLAVSVNIKYYLFTCLRRKLLKSIQANANLNFGCEIDFENLLGGDDGQEKHMIQQEADQKFIFLLKEQFDKLSDLQKEIIYLRFVQGLGFDQISKMMDISIQSSRTLLYRSIKFLRTKLNESDLNVNPDFEFSTYKKAILSALLIIFFN